MPISWASGEAVSISTLPSMPRSRSRRGPSETPKTTRRITSSVTACMRGWIGNASPSGQESTSAAT
jgi:hypothetical protein